METTPRTRAPGRARRLQLLDAARALLGTQALGEITLQQVAKRAGIPTSSAYHFYREIDALMIDLARAIAGEMADRTGPEPISENWSDTVRAMLSVQASLFNADPAARALMLGSQTTFAIKRAACFEDDRFGHALERAIANQFVLPDHLPPELFFKAIQIADVFYSLSVIAHDRVTTEAEHEAIDAVIAYLSLHLPKRLPRSEAAA